MFYTHDLDSVAFSFLGASLHWYWLFYLLGYSIIFYGGQYLIKKKLSPCHYNDFIKTSFWAWIGLFLGSRVFYVLFYNLKLYINDPLQIIQIWRGGMSFHGALIGIGISTLYIAKLDRIKFFYFTDILSFFAPLCLFFGRIGNFINGELAGRVTDVPWAVIFPRIYDDQPRHPSQLYEALGEGLILFIVMIILRKKLQTPGLITKYFLLGYGLIRFLIEFFRMPDKQIGYIFGFLTLGQVFCLVMIIGSVFALKGKDKTSNLSHLTL